MNLDLANLGERERIYLALLCQSRLDAPLRAELLLLLSRHSWNSEDHRAIFEALAGWRVEPEAVRAGLAARLTRLGFPDIDIEEYLALAGVSLETALGWLREEQAGKEGRSGDSERGGNAFDRAAKSK